MPDRLCECEKITGCGGQRGRRRVAFSSQDRVFLTGPGPAGFFFGDLLGEQKSTFSPSTPCLAPYTGVSV